MNILCPTKEPCIEDANSLGNYSSEDPDRELFRSSYFANQIFDGGDDIWTACFGLCVSFESQADADLCAQNNAKICEANKQFGNVTHTCSQVCPDGSTYSFTVPAGSFWSFESQAQADALAKEWCEDYLVALCQSIPGPSNPNPGPTPSPKIPPPGKKACNDALDIYLICPDGRRGWNFPKCTIWADDKFAANFRARTIAEDYITLAIGCLSELPKTACIGDEWNRLVAPSTAAGVTRPVEWEVFGILPPGISSQAKGLTMALTGTFSQAGTFGFRLTMTDKKGMYTYRVYYVSVMEFTTSSPLPSGTMYEAYSTTIAVAGGWDPKIFSLRPGDVLPPGLTIDGNTGVISGTPTANGTWNFRVNCTDNEGGVCHEDYEITIEDNFFDGIPWNFISHESLGGSGWAYGANNHVTIGGSAPAGAGAGGGDGQGIAAFQVNNTTGAPRNCQLRIVITTLNQCPPGVNGGVQTAFADAFSMNATAPVAYNIATSLGLPPIPAGVYTYPFTAPVGLSDYNIFVRTGAAPSANPSPPPLFPGGWVNWEVYLDML